MFPKKPEAFPANVAKISTTATIMLILCIGSVAARCHGVPTEYSQRRTIERDAPEVLRRLREDGADIAMLVPL